MATQQLFNDGVRLTKGKDARKLNLLACKLLTNLVKNCFGPGGKEKMFIDILGEITLTKNGCTFLRKIDVEHPAAKVLIDASNSVDNEVGDGSDNCCIISRGTIGKSGRTIGDEIFANHNFKWLSHGIRSCSHNT